MKNKRYGLESDLLFKHTFGNPELLRIFLKDIFGKEVGKMQYLNKELKKENRHLKYGICDIVVETEEEIILLEMQNQNLYNIEPRIWMYMSKLYTENWKEEDYKNVKPVKVYLILNYPYQEKKVLKEYQELEKELQEQFGGYGEIKIWNLVEAKKEKRGKHAEYGMLFQPTDQDLEKLKKKEKYKKFIECIEIYNMDYESYRAMKEEEAMDMTFEQVYHSIRNHSLQEGIEQGTKLGIEQGIEQGTRLGMEQETRRMIQRMTEKKMSMESMIELTGLTKEEIKKYQE